MAPLLADLFILRLFDNFCANTSLLNPSDIEYKWLISPWSPDITGRGGAGLRLF